jgi:hypothetical protein
MHVKTLKDDAKVINSKNRRPKDEHANNLNCLISPCAKLDSPEWTDIHQRFASASALIEKVDSSNYATVFWNFE